MRKIGIVTDSHSSITQKMAGRLEIMVLSMPFYFDETCYYEDVTLTREAFFSRLKSGANVSTSQPSPAAVMEIWDKALALYDTILYIPISSGLSSSCDTANMLALDEPYEGRVFVVDNGRVSTLMHQSILDAIDLIEAGYSAAECKEILERVRDRMNIYVAVSDLTYLKRGGRISASSAAIGSLLNIKPILSFDVGKLDSFKNCRGTKKARTVMIEALKNDLLTKFSEEYEAGEVRILAASSADTETTEGWLEQIREAFPGEDILRDDLSLGVSCHIGPDGLGIGCSCRPKELYALDKAKGGQA